MKIFWTVFLVCAIIFVISRMYVITSAVAMIVCFCAGYALAKITAKKKMS